MGRGAPNGSHGSKITRVGVGSRSSGSVIEVSSDDTRMILIATDDDATFDEVDAAIADDRTYVQRVRAGRDVRPAVHELEPDLVICDLQIGNMGGVATALDLRLEEGAGRMDSRPIMLLLDRADDLFVARRSGADDWVFKPLDSLSLRRTAESLLATAPAAAAD
jgi:DNA-binding response OmpR family regulator